MNGSEERSSMRKVRSVLQILSVVALIYCIVLSFAVTIFAIKAFGDVRAAYASVLDLKESAPAQSQFMKDLVDSNPKVNIRQSFIPLSKVSENLKRAVIAGEDPGFYYHPGFDVRGIARALESNVASGKILYGGSTITQQLAKNLFLTGKKTYERKVKELGFALLMEHELGKDRILELYLNYAQWGKSIFGCESASRVYFDKSCSDLNMEESVKLSAMLMSPCNHTPDMVDSLIEGRRKIIYRNLGSLVPASSENSP